MAIHADWHIARPVHDRLSLGWSAHWLLAIPVFLGAGWYLARRWPGAWLRPAALSVGLGVLLGQAVEPLVEALHYQFPVAEAFEAPRLAAFAAFFAAGLATLAVFRVVQGPRQAR